MAVENARARIPSQQRVVVAVRSDRFSLFEAMHGFHQPIERADARARPAACELRLGAALAHDAFVIRAVVSIAEAGCEIDRLAIGTRCALELVGQGQDEGNPRRLVVRINLQDVAADALRLTWLIE